MADVTFRPHNRTIKVRPGTTVLSAARKAGVFIRSRCGGTAACLMCKVTAEPNSRIMTMQPKERLKLGPLAEEGVRLACQAVLQGDSVIHVPEDPLKAAIRRRLEQQEEDTLW
ncbi:2Fe-2S iron-sulfur cluster-binding protein [Paenibacillus alkalitolerans]|uniref:2Fe-2S iron-sulfur cluster-binding protein n=1 Tax=Paenibacillus alkalitolerans TaxID=2799335 RepID=UPI0018F5A742|nr:2Fe-2S iron-sulfur cluster-binding protein [Paenibacillus alkalitolerans]